MASAPSYAEIRDVARAAETSGFDSLWVYDHLLFRSDGKTTGIHECWTILSAIAEATERVELGTIVMCTSFRNPALLAKMAATLDHISGGRLILGIGCGWHDPEYEAFGYPTDHKVGRFEEALTIIRGLIRDGRADLEGRGSAASDAVLLPAGATGPAHPHRGQAPAHARADRAPRRRLEPGLVRASRRASWPPAGPTCWRRAPRSVATRRRSSRRSASRSAIRTSSPSPPPAPPPAARSPGSAEEVAAGFLAHVDAGRAAPHRGARSDDARRRRAPGRGGPGRPRVPPSAGEGRALREVGQVGQDEHVLPAELALARRPAARTTTSPSDAARTGGPARSG